MEEAIKLNLDTLSKSTLIAFARKLVLSFNSLYYRLLLGNVKLNTYDLHLFLQINNLNQLLLTSPKSDELTGLLQYIINLCNSESVNNIFTIHINDDINLLRKVGDSNYGKNNSEELSI